MRARALMAAGLLAGLAGCGGGDERPATAPTAADPAEVRPLPRRLERTGPAERDAERVVRAWTAAEARSDPTAAARLFTVPAVVENGVGPQRLASRAAITVWNAALPCGARVLRVYAAGRYTVATFELRDRPGSRCDGVGLRAATAFLVEDGRIAEWRRVADPPGNPPAVPPADLDVA